MYSALTVKTDFVGLYVEIKRAVFRPESLLPPRAVDARSVYCVTYDTKYADGQSLQGFATAGSSLAKVGDEWWYIDVQDTDPIIAAKFRNSLDYLADAGTTIRAQRKKLGISQKRVADLLGVRLGYKVYPNKVSLNEHGKGWDDGLELLKAYGDILELPLWQFHAAAGQILGRDVNDAVFECQRLLHAAEEFDVLARLIGEQSITQEEIVAHAMALRKRARYLVKGQ